MNGSKARAPAEIRPQQFLCIFQLLEVEGFYKIIYQLISFLIYIVFVILFMRKQKVSSNSKNGNILQKSTFHLCKRSQLEYVFRAKVKPWVEIKSESRKRKWSSQKRGVVLLLLLDYPGIARQSTSRGNRYRFTSKVT